MAVLRNEITTMDIFTFEGTSKTPYIYFNPHSGEMVIKGRAIPQNAEEFWSPILKWFYAYAVKPSETTRLTFHFDYFNITSSKRVLFLLHKLNEMHENGRKVSVEWRYSEGDHDMKEVGEDYSTMISFPFEIIAFKEELIAAV